MFAAHIIEAIERRRAQYRSLCRCSCAANLSESDRVNARIAEEYDSLMREVEVLRHEHLNPHPPLPTFQEDQSDQWKLGDLGQKGG